MRASAKVGAVRSVLFNGNTGDLGALGAGGALGATGAFGAMGALGLSAVAICEAGAEADARGASYTLYP